ncbi:MAG: 6-carboxytetrahydropterin synthase QueD [Candidatus Omnitrophica bacterium]|nr:6-carboxytetrahydropterin synthase QueD [Candidatus Omnitrophota bacterium]
MYNIKVESNFSSAHNLRGYKGKCEELHGHNWKVMVELERDSLDKLGMVFDFQFVKKELYKVLEKLDHKYLNKVSYFKRVNPTSEALAKYIYGLLKRKLKNIKSVTVWESENCSATYHE